MEKKKSSVSKTKKVSVKKVEAKLKAPKTKTKPELKTSTKSKTKKKVEVTPVKKVSQKTVNVRVSRILNPTELTKAIAKKGFTVGDLGKKLNCTRQYISAMINNRTVVAPDKAEKISSILSVKTDKIFTKNPNGYFSAK